MTTNVGKITTIFDKNVSLQQMIINVALQKAITDIYGLLLETPEEYYAYQEEANKMFDYLEQFQKMFPDEYNFCYPTQKEDVKND